MTSLPTPSPGARKLGLVIDLDTCVGCHACATNCKEWNTSGHMAPLPDHHPYSAAQEGVWFNRVHGYEAGDGEDGRTVHFPRSCLHCETPACVTVCPTGASYKRAEDGIVLVNTDMCIGCQLCAWACPYGAREFDEDQGVMKKCTLCVDRIYNEAIPEPQRVPACVATCPAKARHFGDLGDPDSAVSQLVAARGGYELMPELGYAPVNRYLPPRRAPKGGDAPPKDAGPLPSQITNPLLRWVDKVLSRVNPAPSIIFFTVASGAGYGLLFWMGLLRPFGLVPGSALFGAMAIGLALALVMLGLLSSTAHLGRPERAWRALSQWRSSWLSREGVAAIATFAPAGLFLIAVAGGMERLAIWAGLLSAAGAAVTVYCTGMIYASLKPIRQWHHPLVTPGYLLFGAFSGAALLAMLAAFWGQAAVPAAIAAVLGALGFALKRAYWASVDTATPASTMESATGLGFIGKVRTLEPPHTETNYLLREMAFRIGRVHAARLRMIASVAGFAAPAVLLAVALLAGGGIGVVLAALASVSALVGLLAERWLMFAEATHTVALYYGAGAGR